MPYQKKSGNLLTASFLIAGTSIGTGFIALPFAIGITGFVPGILTTVIIWVYIVACGILYLEAALAVPDGGNVISICHSLIGSPGMVFGAVSFVLINLSFMGDYFSVGTSTLSWLIDYLFQVQLPNAIILSCLFLAILTIVFLGVHVTGRVNFILVAGLLISLFLTLGLDSENILIERFMKREWFLLLFSIPVLFRAFDFQNIIPTLIPYLDRNPKKLRNMILVGTLIILFFYLAWEYAIIGMFNEGDLWVGYESPDPHLEMLRLLSSTPRIKKVFYFLIFFSVTTSMLGCSLSFVDFLGDGTRIPLQQRKGINRFSLCLAFLVPSLVLSILSVENIFHINDFLIDFLELAFNGILPVWLAWSARYILKRDIPHILPGGRVGLILLSAATFILIYIQGVEIIRKVDI